MDVRQTFCTSCASYLQFEVNVSNFIHPNLSVEMLTEVVGIKIAQVGQTTDHKITVVIIYYNIFLPLLLTLLSDNLVLLSPTIRGM